MLTNKPFSKDFQIFETCVLVDSNLCGKLTSSIESPTKFEKSFKFTTVSFFVPDFNLLSGEL